jgi:septum formation protein
VLVLASRSPQRRAILEQLGVAFEARPSEVEELTAGEPSALVVENALRKARAAPGDHVLGADTAVALGDRVLGRPADEGEARGFLRDLSGATHEVWTGVALIRDGVERTAVARTDVRFRALSEGDVERYLAAGEWRGRAGGYAIQGLGATLVESIEGDYFNVVGLPVATLVGLDPGLFVGGP